MKIHLVSALALGLVAPGGQGGQVVPGQTAPCATCPPPFATKKVCPGPECVPCQQGCTINVAMQKDNGKCTVKGLSEAHKIYHVRLGKEVSYVFRNECDSTMNLGVGKFGLHPAATCTDSARHECCHKFDPLDDDPFVKGARDVRVQPKQTRTLRLAIRKDALRPRTYKYAIMVDGNPELDPEIEIER